MHSKIFQISKEPIKPDNYINEEEYYDGFVGTIADYTTTLNGDDRGFALKGLKKIFEGVIEIENDRLTIVDKTLYFEDKYKRFKEALQKLSNVSLEDFSGTSIDTDVFELQDAYNDKYSLYIDDCFEFFGICTFNNFMRNVKNGDVYYIGGVVDYHF